MNPLRDLTEIAMAIISIAFFTLLLSKPQGTAQVIGAASAGFGDILKVVTLQS